MAGFGELLASARSSDGGFMLDVPESWHQGRTAYGGFSSALALAAALRLGEDLPPLRSAQVAMIAPLAGEIGLHARILRRGKNATWIHAEITGEKGVGLTANFVFMGPVDSALHLNQRPLPAGIIPVAEARPFTNARGPAFLQNHFEVRFALPRPDEKRAELCWWVRLRERAGIDPITELVLCADALPPGVMPLLAPSVPVSTMHWQLSLLTPAPATDDGWWLLRSASDYAEKGCSSQRMAIWNSEGEPMLSGMQAVAVFG